MATVKIKSIKKQYIMEDRNYAYIKANLGKELPLLSLTFFEDGVIHSIAIHAEQGCITLFVDGNVVDYEINLQNCTTHIVGGPIVNHTEETTDGD